MFQASYRPFLFLAAASMLVLGGCGAIPAVSGTAVTQTAQTLEASARRHDHMTVRPIISNLLIKRYDAVWVHNLVAETTSDSSVFEFQGTVGLSGDMKWVEGRYNTKMRRLQITKENYVSQYPDY